MTETKKINVKKNKICFPPPLLPTLNPSHLRPSSTTLTFIIIRPFTLIYARKRHPSIPPSFTTFTSVSFLRSPLLFFKASPFYYTRFTRCTRFANF